MVKSMFSSPRTAFLAFIALVYIKIVSCSHPDIANYHENCHSLVPESTITSPEFTNIPFPPNQDGYYLGGDTMFDHPNSTLYYYSPSSRRVLLFRTNHVHSTNTDGVYKVEASLILQPSSIHYYVEDVTYSYSFSPRVISSWSERGTLSFELEGFWSKSTGKLCMVGSSSSSSAQGEPRLLKALLKLSNVRNKSTINSLIKGTLFSLSTGGDSSYFEPLSILMFPRMNYAYTEVSKQLDSVCIEEADTSKSSLQLRLSTPLCSIFSGWSNSFKLLYGDGCDSAKKCNPFGESVGFLPRVMSMNLIECSTDKPSLRILLEFPNSSYADYYLPFSPNRSLIAEGSWNAKKNHVCVVACRISDATSSFNSSSVEDCSIRLSIRFPSVWSVRTTSDIEGHIWSNKHRNEVGYFESIRFQHTRQGVLGIPLPGLKYEYSLVAKAKKYCQEKQSARKKGSKYPDPYSNEMQFDMSVKNSSGNRIGYGRAQPVFVGDRIPSRNIHSMPSESTPAKSQQPSSLNISYNIIFPFSNASSNEQVQVEISAEGIYDGETGAMCLVGCRYVDSNNQIPRNDVMDCEILISMEFPTVDSDKYIQGHIKSTRKESDPLYLQPLSFSASSFYSRHARRSIWRMDLEIIMALISNTLYCFIVGYQILYVKKNPTLSPFISILMMIVLILGQTIPLMLNFEALFFSKQNRQSYFRRTSGWLELNEVIVRVVTMVAFVLQVRLLQFLWSSRLAHGNSKATWNAEKKTAYVSLPVYIIGAAIAVSLNWKDYEFGNKLNYSTRVISSNNRQHSLWIDLRSYAGLALDSFLFPQIIFNILNNSREKALSCLFYMGATLVRLIPHMYDLYRAHYYVDEFDWSYRYANHSADYYSTSWNLIISVGGVLFASIVYLQQRDGGRFFLPRRFKELEGHEKLPIASDDP